MPTRSQSDVGIAFDTNMLLAIGQLKVDAVSEARKKFGANARLVVPKQVLDELKELEKGGEKVRKAVKIAFEQAESNLEKVYVEAENADGALAKMAERGFLVATNDAELRKRIKGFGGKVIYLRQRHFLELD